MEEQILLIKQTKQAAILAAWKRRSVRLFFFSLFFRRRMIFDPPAACLPPAHNMAHAVQSMFVCFPDGFGRRTGIDNLKCGKNSSPDSAWIWPAGVSFPHSCGLL